MAAVDKTMGNASSQSKATDNLQSAHAAGQAQHQCSSFVYDAGTISACVAPLFSQRPDIHQWLHHYTQLGVNKFYMYVPRLHYHEPHTYEAPHEVCL